LRIVDQVREVFRGAGNKSSTFSVVADHDEETKKYFAIYAKSTQLVEYIGYIITGGK